VCMCGCVCVGVYALSSAMLACVCMCGCVCVCVYALSSAMLACVCMCVYTEGYIIFIQARYCVKFIFDFIE